MAFGNATKGYVKKHSGSGGGGGTSNYNDLSNKPSINGVTLSGNKTSEDLNIKSVRTFEYVGTGTNTNTLTIPNLSNENMIFIKSVGHDSSNFYTHAYGDINFMQVDYRGAQSSSNYLDCSYENGVLTIQGTDYVQTMNALNTDYIMYIL